MHNYKRHNILHLPVTEGPIPDVVVSWSCDEVMWSVVVSFPRTPPVSTEAEAAELEGGLVAVVSSAFTSSDTVLPKVSPVVKSRSSSDEVVDDTDVVSSSKWEEEEELVLESKSVEETKEASVSDEYNSVLVSSVEELELVDESPVEEYSSVVVSCDV